MVTFSVLASPGLSLILSSCHPCRFSFLHLSTQNRLRFYINLNMEFRKSVFTIDKSKNIKKPSSTCLNKAYQTLCHCPFMKVHKNDKRLKALTYSDGLWQRRQRWVKKIWEAGIQIHEQDGVSWRRLQTMGLETDKLRSHLILNTNPSKAPQTENSR